MRRPKLRRRAPAPLVVLALAAACAPAAQEPPAERAAAAKRVEVAAVTAARESRELRFAGTTRAARRAKLAFTFGGRLAARPVELGERVPRGRLVARLEDSEPRNALAAARGARAELAARRAQVERDRERAERLAAGRAATGEELERATAAAAALAAAEEAAAARLEEAERRLAETRLAAPFDGTVTAVLLEPGEYAAAGAPVVELAGDGEVEVEVEVPESVVARLAAGDAVTLELPVLGSGPVAARISRLARTAAPGRLFPVVASVPASAGLPAGAVAELVVRLEDDAALALPVEAVIDPGGRSPSVYRLAESSQDAARVERVAVEVGALVGERVLVRGALREGDRVVVGGQRGLLDGETVEVVR